MKENKKIFLKSLMIIVIMIMFSGAVACAFLLGFNNFVPNKVKILDDGKQVYFTCDMSSDYQLYRFHFKSGEKEIFIDSEDNSISVKEALEKGVKLGNDYDISVSYINDSRGLNSEKSKSIAWTCYDYLEAPTLIFDQESNMLYWQQIENADYYDVYFQEGTIVCEENFLDLKNLKGGIKTFNCVARSENPYLKESEVSKLLTVTVVHKLKQFINVDFDDSTKMLSLENEEKISKLVVYVGQDADFVRHEIIISGTYNPSTNTFNYLPVDLSYIYDGQANLGICPMGEDEYNVYDGEILFIV